MANDKPGYVYILTNPSFREDWVKIGRTQNMEERLRTLDTTALPLPFKKYATLKTIKYQAAEKHVHHFIETFTNRRIRANREFFNVTPEEALSIFREVAELLDDAEIEVFADKEEERTTQVKSQTTHRKKAKKEHRPPMDFIKMGMQKGDVLHFRRDPSITITVNSARSVLYQGKEYAISALTRDLLNASYYRAPGTYWTYNGRLLSDIYEETYPLEEQ